MKKNMGIVDVTIRIVIAFVLIGLYFESLISGTLAIVLLILAGIFFLTSLIGFCPFYVLLGINTRKKKE